jgi:hypothetical protein
VIDYEKDYSDLNQLRNKLLNFLRLQDIPHLCFESGKVSPPACQYIENYDQLRKLQAELSLFSTDELKKIIFKLKNSLKNRFISKLKRIWDAIKVKV